MQREKYAAGRAINKPFEWVRKRSPTSNKRRDWMGIIKLLMTQGRRKCSINPRGLYLERSRRVCLQPPWLMKHFPVH